MKKFRLLLVSVLLILFDQFTKYLATIKLKGNEPFDVIKGVFQFYYHENDGAVWGIMGGKTIFLLIFTLIILIGVLYVYFKLPEGKRYMPTKFICLFIIAGAIGNMIDRFVYHYVVDFLYFELIDFPIFNVADIYITVSSFLLLILCFFYYKEDDFSFLGSKEKKEN